MALNYWLKRVKIRVHELNYFIFIMLPSLLLGSIKGNMIRIHWGRIEKNFGDCLAPIILTHYGFLPVYCSSNNKSDAVVVGTILHTLSNGYDGFILGCGGNDEQYSFPYAKVISVRGYHTKENIAPYPSECAVGDPGLLISLIINDEVAKKYKVGIVPHFVDHDHRFVNNLKSLLGKNCSVINVRDDPLIVIRRIRECDMIVSSSLHGLVVADSYNIPNIRFVIKETMPTPFYDFKFYDYYSAIDRKHNQVILDEVIDPEYILSLCSTDFSKTQSIINIMNSVFTNFSHRYLKRA